MLSSSGSRFLDQYTEQFRDRPDLARRSRTQALARTNVRSIGGRPLCSNPSVSEGSMRSIAAARIDRALRCPREAPVSGRGADIPGH